MIGEYGLIPTQAFLYFPSSNQIQQTRNNKKQRIIFCGAIDYDLEEKEKINTFKSFIQETRKDTLILDFADDMILRFLQATSFQNEQCAKALIEYNKWQLKTLPLQITSKIQNFLKQGILYLSGRDYCFRPIIIVNVGKIIALKIKENDLKEVLGYFFQFMIENCLIEGQVETWISIIDLNNESIFSLGGALMNIISFLSSIFKARVCHTYLLKCPSSMKMLWSMIKKVLNEDQIRKLTFTDKNYLKPEYFETINRQQVEKKYGGELSDLQQFWPIKSNEKPIETQLHRCQLIEEGDYNAMFEANELMNRKIKKCLLRKFQNEDVMNNTLSEEDKNTQKVQEKEEEDFSGIEFPCQKLPTTYEIELPTPLTFDLISNQ